MLGLIDSGGPGAVADDMIPKLLGTSTLAARPDVVGHVRRLIESQSKEALADATRAMMAREDSTSLLATLDVPALVIVGEEDTLTPPEESERMAATLPRATLVRIPGAGHLSSLEDPAAFNEAVTRFLRSI
jgi:pimeloyl-ACP methyl ester carboxylesterase